MTLRSICLHGPESTGKSTLAPQLARHFGTRCIDEFGRTYCEAYGTDLTMADLVVIARAHDAKAVAAIAGGPHPVILDTDPLMSAVWADMLFGRRDPWFDEWRGYADLYLLVRHRPALGGGRHSHVRDRGGPTTLLRAVAARARPPRGALGAGVGRGFATLPQRSCRDRGDKGSGSLAPRLTQVLPFCEPAGPVTRAV
jgi:hypothetical protein